MIIRYTECGKCKRKLTNIKSMERGYGRHCHKVIKTRMRLLCAAYSVDQVNKAYAILKTATMRHCAPGVWWTPASNGHDEYLTSTGSCQCQAGKRGRACYHRLAVEIRELIPTR